MAERRPLVVINGEVQELPANDTLVGGFLRNPDELDDSDSTYFYFGWTDVVGGSWLVRRTQRDNAAQTSAFEPTNTSFATLATAWADRANLNYS